MPSVDGFLATAMSKIYIMDFGIPRLHGQDGVRPVAKIGPQIHLSSGHIGRVPTDTALQEFHSWNLHYATTNLEDVLGGPIQLDKRQLSQGFLDALPSGLKESVEGYGLKQFLSTLELVLPIDKAVKTDVLQARIRTTAKRSRVMWGPYNFEASNKDAKPGPITQGAMEIGLQMDPNGQMGFKRLHGFCQDCTVIHGSAYVANEKGERLNVKDGVFIHHLGMLDPRRESKPLYSCNGKESAPYQSFLGSGVDESEYFYTSSNGSYNSGYYIKDGEIFSLQYEIINYTPTAQKWYIAADYEYVDGKAPGVEDVTVTALNSQSCFGWERAQIKPPPEKKQFTNTSPDFVMAQDGTVLRLMGHLHDGGENIELLLNNKTVCDSRATYGGKNSMHAQDGTVLESIEAMSACTDLIPIKKGDVVKLVSHYDVEKHPV
ncbi:hypothetical protein EG328_005638 [Venturia inaequalis]|uniref:Uncharacterized protein n=1 Tax=Venturia inaequalis TaxID=5025 RepID=A0A8H3ZAA5_VENIN|nr:hypothetical protein EG328_005638 [Venturia inaequalis]